ncbi:MAG: tetratricopeptide repeat protein [Candidatus Omnitrophica bacterium]|nr:tetratricopeptide repeat protein [Candidatus Omnitrophota bacterium]
MKRIIFIAVILGGILLPRIAFTQVDTGHLSLEGAMRAFTSRDFEKAKLRASEAIRYLREKADKQQKNISEKKISETLRIWIDPQQTNLSGSDEFPIMIENERIVSVGWKELNDIGKACFVQAEIFKQEGELKKVKQIYQDIIMKYPDAYQRGYHGWFWKMSEFAQDSLDLMGTSYDYEDYSAKILLKKADEAFKSNNTEGVKLYTGKCIRLYDSQDSKFKKEVAVSHYLLGKMYLKNNRRKEAAEKFKRVIQNYPTTIYPNIKDYPYFSNITDKAADHLALMGTSYSYGNYTSETLTIKAWKCWDIKDYKGVELYTTKCIKLFSKRAAQMQKKMKNFARLGYVPYFWALNDVGTCHFILGLAYQKQNKPRKSKEMFQSIIENYGYAQCWDPKGHYWKVAEVSKTKLAELNEK